MDLKETKIYKTLLWKAYFDKGFSLLHYLRYLILIFGFLEVVAAKNLKYTISGALIYGVVCFILGKLWFKYQLIDVENEVQNNVNPFQREVRDSLRNGKFKKF